MLYVASPVGASMVTKDAMEQVVTLFKGFLPKICLCSAERWGGHGPPAPPGCAGPVLEKCTFNSDFDIPDSSLNVLNHKNLQLCDGKLLVPCS